MNTTKSNIYVHHWTQGGQNLGNHYESRWYCLNVSNDNDRVCSDAIKCRFMQLSYPVVSNFKSKVSEDSLWVIGLAGPLEQCQWICKRRNYDSGAWRYFRMAGKREFRYPYRKESPNLPPGAPTDRRNNIRRFLKLAFWPQCSVRHILTKFWRAILKISKNGHFS